MPTPDLIQGVPLPTYDDPAAIPDDLANVFYANLSRGIPRFSTTAQRDAAYPSPTDGQHCWITAENAVYVRIDGAWERAPRSIAVAPSAFFAPASGITINAGGTNAEITGKQLVWQMRLDRTGGFALTSGQQITSLGAVALPYRPRGYFAPWSGWGGASVIQGLCGQVDGDLSIRWASGSGSPTHLVLGGAWPIA